MTITSRTCRTTLKYTLIGASEERKDRKHRKIILRNGQTFLIHKLYVKNGGRGTEQYQETCKDTTTDYITKRKRKVFLKLSGKKILVYRNNHLNNY